MTDRRVIAFNANKNPIERRRLNIHYYLENAEEIARIGWYINPQMRKRFESGEYHPYKIIENHPEGEIYTHMSDDGYIYHKLWFMNEHIIKLEDEDFFV